MWFVVALASAGCSHNEEEWPGYTKDSGDLDAFVLDSSGKLGARPRDTNNLPQVNAQWVYKADNDRATIVLTGNHFAELQNILTNAFGPLPQPASVNPRSMGASLGPQAGAEITFTWDKTTDNKEYTTLVISRLQKPSKAPP
jgi:hypothetical protein